MKTRFKQTFFLTACFSLGLGMLACSTNSHVVNTSDVVTGDDASGATCGQNEHMCGTRCVANNDNVPELGCTLGCGSPCPTRDNARSFCRTDGLCSFECLPPFMLQGGECVCVPTTCEGLGLECGMISDGCGMTANCGTCPSGICSEGFCGCGPDEFESNQTLGTAFAGTDLDDDPGDNDLPSSAVVTSASLSSIGDSDWFKWHVDDTFQVISQNPLLKVTLSNIPTGDNYALQAFYVADGTCTANHECRIGMLDTTMGRGCSSNNAGNSNEQIELYTDCGGSTSEDGTLYVRVYSTTNRESCANYRLLIEASDD